MGPGLRAVIWVQGCSLGCPGCISVDSWGSSEGESMLVSDLASWVEAQTGIEGITLSGGEPMQQAAALNLLIKRVRLTRELGVVCYTGYTYEYLNRSGNPEQMNLLAAVDLLIDGRYVAAKHANLRWRGSSNQRLIALTDRYRDTVKAIEEGQDMSAGLEFSMDADGSLIYVGVPPVQGFEAEFERLLQNRGIRLTPSLREKIEG